MQVTSNGQVTIPQEIRNQLGLLPNTEWSSNWLATMPTSAKPANCPAEALEAGSRSISCVAPPTFA